ncbi:MAG: chromosome segregation protein SMC [Alphaproteobacteria bacterium]|nr:MAG: chromosome segregation protein SMC [Alphaproteobacteria bacterium]
MKINRLRLLGFKSFVEPTDVVIENGLTGIVGPNGCGKSNLVEALRFVMGESSYKAMRGSAMEDVIFSGAANRPARNTAEVTLFADPAGSPLPPGIPAGEDLQISRRIEREVGSAYRINGKDARARDVQLLFADAATGARSSALVRQGQIGEIIAAKPTQRRQILEDAAGISGLHSRRHEAELKLKAAEQNLERLDDVMAEIASQFEALKRQARQAVRYRKISGEIRKAEATLFLIRWQAAGERLGEAEKALTAASASLGEAAQAQAKSARDEAVAADRLPDLRQRAAEAGAALQRMQLMADELDRQEERQKARKAETSSRCEQTRTDLAREREIGEESRSAMARIAAEEGVLTGEQGSTGDNAEEARRRTAELAAIVAEREAELSTSSSQLAAVLAERNALDRGIADGEARLARFETDTAGLLAERGTLEGERAADKALEGGRRAFQEAERVLAAQEAEAEAAEATLAGVRRQEVAARAPLDETTRALAALESEAGTLARILQVEKADLFPPVIDVLKVDAGLELALAVALGDDLEASLDEGAPRNWGDPGNDESDPALPAGVDCLADHVRGPAALRRRLRQIGIVSAAQGQKLAGELKPGQRLVSRAGDLWRWDGFRIQAGTPTAAAMRLEQKNRLAALDGEIARARDELGVKSAAVESAANRLREAESKDQAARATLRDARNGADRARAALAEAERRAGRHSERLSAIGEALSRIETESTACSDGLTTARQSLAALPQGEPLETERAEIQDRLSGERARAAEARAASDALGNEAKIRARRLAALAEEKIAWTTRTARAGGRVADLERRLSELEAQLAELAAEPETIEQRRRALMDETASAEAGARAAADILAEAETTHRNASAAARQGLEQLSGARESRARQEERMEAARQSGTEVQRQIKDVFGCPPADLHELAGLAIDAPLPVVEASESRIDRLKRERERLGGVNLRAEEEAREIETRLTALTEECDDLGAAIRRLRQGIQTLNREGRERLLAAFEVVNGHFHGLFTHLFGGGAAELMLTESDDPLEAGLEIMARPPGKKPQTMSLLSGGEQALTAMALIFAVFLTNPSPICVLDEVDASLDDANVERFCALLEDMRSRTETRFIVVTHNPITMARMDRLIGVTMAERGVSQLVSVDLQTAEQFREAV